MSPTLEDWFIMFERKMIREYGLSYSDMQDIPFRTLWKWMKADLKHQQQKQFEKMVKENARNN